MMKRTRSQTVHTQKMIPYDAPPVWVLYPSDIFTYQNENLFEVLLETRHEGEEKDWTSLQSTIQKKRQREKTLYTHVQTLSMRTAFLEDYSEHQTPHLLSRLLRQQWEWIQRIRFSNPRSHVRGVCDGLVHRSLLAKLVPQTQETLPEDEYFLVFLKTSLDARRAEDYRLEVMTLYHTFGRHLPVRVSKTHVLFVDKHQQCVLPEVDMSLAVQKEMFTMFRAIRRIKTWSPLMDLDDPLPVSARPNMKTGHSFFQKEKKDIAIRNGEITLLWKCNVKERKLAFSQGIHSWRDPRFSPSVIGWTDPLDTMILQRIVDVNRSTEDSTWFYMDPRVHDRFPMLQETSTRHLFIDFEYMDDMLYLIGVYDGSTYKAFWSETMTDEGMRSLWDRFSTYLREEEPHSHCWYWYAEERQLKKWGFETESEWQDLWRVCRYGAVRDAFDFSLKSWVFAFYKHGKIPFCYEDLVCQNGASSLEFAREVYEESDPEKKQHLETYNRYDCEAMWHIFREILSR